MHTLTTEQGIKIQVTDEQYAQLVMSHKKWRAKYGKEYFYINSFGDVDWVFEYAKPEDDHRYLTGNYHRTREEAEQALAYQKALGTLTHAIYERNAGWEADWGNEKQSKWIIWYNHAGKSFKCTAATYTQDAVQLYCASKEIAESIIKDFQEELKVVFNVK